jgi:hypothetical protein
MIVPTNQQPPCWERLEKAFGVYWVPGVHVTYGSEIYCHDDAITNEFLVHELVHVEQQKRMAPDAYLDLFIASADFRMEMELPAYRVHNEYLRATLTNKDEVFVKINRNQRSLARITGKPLEEIQLILPQL